MPLMMICWGCQYLTTCGGDNGDIDYVNGIPTFCWRFSPEDSACESK